jgi:predicted Zn-dependent peptidase
MDRMDAVYAELQAERDKGRLGDAAKIEKLEADFKALQEEADKYIEHDEYEEALERSGGSGLNAGTWYDATQYYLSLPSNKLELWMSLESERFLDPVFREFYKERDVVMEERRMRTDNQPFGKLIEETVSTAFKAHPYGEPPIGHMSDLKSFSRTEAQKFFQTYYGPSNLTAVVVGDADPKQVKQYAETYFGRIPSRPAPPVVETVEPEQLGERRVTIEDPSQPLVMIVYHKPDANDPDNAVFDTITDIMGAGRTSRLYTSLVKEKKIAIAAGGFSGLLGNKYPNLFVFFAVPAQGHTPDECEAAIYEEIDKLKNELVTADELKKSKTRSRASLVRQLQSDNGLAAQLAEYQVIYGDWRKLFTQLDDLNAVTAEDVKRVAGATFKASNRTVGTLKTTKTEDKPQS